MVGVKRGSVEYWNRATVVDPLGSTVALSVAPVARIGAAAPVATVGSKLSRVLPSSASSPDSHPAQRGRLRPRAAGRRHRRAPRPSWVTAWYRTRSVPL